MKTSLTTFPFSVFAETKISAKGNKYLSLSVRYRQKDKDGNKKDTYFNLIDKKDFLVLAQLLNRAFNYIGDLERKEQIEEYERKKAAETPKDPCPESDGWVKVNDNAWGNQSQVEQPKQTNDVPCASQADTTFRDDEIPF